MKKAKGLIFLGLSFLLLGACGNTNQEPKKETYEKTKETKKISEVIANETVESSMNNGFDGYSFKNGVLKTPEMEIKIDKAEVGHATGEDGLILWFTIRNKNDFNIIPQSELGIFDIKQQDDTSEYQIETDYNYVDVAEMLYPRYNDDGSTVDDDLYEKNGILQSEHDETYDKKFYSELLPGKEVKTAIGLHLENTEHPVVIKLTEPYASNVKAEDYIINLK